MHTVRFHPWQNRIKFRRRSCRSSEYDGCQYSLNLPHHACATMRSVWASTIRSEIMILFYSPSATKPTYYTHIDNITAVADGGATTMVIMFFNKIARRKMLLLLFYWRSCVGKNGYTQNMAAMVAFFVRVAHVHHCKISRTSPRVYISVVRRQGAMKTIWWI